MTLAQDLPAELAQLLNASDDVARERAWKRFLERYSRLILHALRRVGREYDAVMDGYAYVLEHLRRDEFRRLRAYTPSARSQFSTWLVVVVHRLGLDHYRHRYGYSRRPLAGGSHPDSAPVVRRRLVDLLAEPLESVGPIATTAGNPDAAIRQQELEAALEAALGELPPRDRLLLKLRFELAMSARKIAAIMAFPTPLHVYRRCDHVCRELRISLADRGVDDSLP